MEHLQVLSLYIWADKEGTPGKATHKDKLELGKAEEQKLSEAEDSPAL